MPMGPLAAPAHPSSSATLNIPPLTPPQPSPKPLSPLSP